MRVRLDNDYHLLHLHYIGTSVKTPQAEKNRGRGVTVQWVECMSSMQKVLGTTSYCQNVYYFKKKQQQLGTWRAEEGRQI